MKSSSEKGKTDEKYLHRLELYVYNIYQIPLDLKSTKVLLESFELFVG